MKRGLVALIVALVMTGGYYAYGATTATKVKVSLATPTREFGLKPLTPSVKAGTITFVASDKGKLDHELVVLKTNLAPSKLPVKGTKAVEVGRVGKLPPLKPGQTKTLTLKLKPGKYVLICNVPAHYKAGQRAAFTVR